jgi:hypothetical protein
MPAAKKADPRDGHDTLVEKAAAALRDAGHVPQHAILRFLPDEMLQAIIDYWSAGHVG